jgi:DNA-binding response OmpR family regulator
MATTHEAIPGTSPATGQPGRAQTLTVLLYSDDSSVREKVQLAVGRRPAADLPAVEWIECATAPAVISAADAGRADVLVLDGEAVPVGGMGLCRQLKNEIYRCPPVLVLIGRTEDAWLASWSQADLAVPHPLDPAAVAQAVAELARRRLG